MKSTTNIENIVLDTLVHLHMDGYDSYACVQGQFFLRWKKLDIKNLIFLQLFKTFLVRI